MKEANPERTTSQRCATTFEALGLSAEVAQHLDTRLGFTAPTAVQAQVIPEVIAGRDVLVKSETGSGKTLAFLLPIVHALQRVSPRPSRESGLCAIVLSPTRELCLQIYNVLERVLQRFHWVVAAALMGGEKRKSEKARLRKGLHVMVATPGRFIDHMEKTASLLSSVAKGNLRFFVLDEADRLLDAGFSKQIHHAVDTIKATLLEKNISRRPQNIFLSATLGPSISSLAHTVLNDPVLVDVHAREVPSGAEDIPAQSTVQVPTGLVQRVLVTHRKERLTTLCAFVLRQVVSSGNRSKMMLFVSCRAQVDYLHLLLQQIKWPPHTGDTAAHTEGTGLGTQFWKLHGSIGQQERRLTVQQFTASRGGVLICTDVAARGLDLPSVDWIIQYDPPSEVEDYVHRIGRTARSGRKGSAVLFLCEEERPYLDLLAGQNLSLLSLDQEAVIKALLRPSKSLRKRPMGKGRGSLAARAQRDPEAARDLMQIKLEDMVNQGEEAGKQSQHRKKRRERAKSGNSQTQAGDVNVVSLKQLAEDAYVSFIRAYAVHSKESKAIFHPKNLHLGHVARSFGLRAPPKGK